MGARDFVAGIENLTFLLIILLMASSVGADKLSKENKNGNSGGTLSTENNTKDELNQGLTGNRRAVQYGFGNPNRQCYTQFFVGGQPPTGLRHDVVLQHIRYICQPPTQNQQPQQTHYATMFDERFGIALFSAYTLTPATATFPPFFGQSWSPTPGIVNQGNAALYQNQQNYRRGHLIPAQTFSSTQQRSGSTYTYTNTVPLRQDFQELKWSHYENEIRKYAEDTCTKQHQAQPAGTLYLLTGTSFAGISEDRSPRLNVIDYISPHNSNVQIPNSLWTAGCCVRRNGDVKSFAVIENNIDEHPLTMQVNVAELQNILAADVINNHNIGGPNVHLFPGNPRCSNAQNNILLAQAPQGR